MLKNKNRSHQWYEFYNGWYGCITRIVRYEYELELTDSEGVTTVHYFRRKQDALDYWNSTVGKPTEVWALVTIYQPAELEVRPIVNIYAFDTKAKAKYAKDKMRGELSGWGLQDTRFHIRRVLNGETLEYLSMN